MDSIAKQPGVGIRRLIWLSCFSMAGGGFYYLTFRWQGNYLADVWVGFGVIRQGVSDPTAGALPSLLHMLALGALSAALLGERTGAKLTVFLLLMTLVAEKTLGVFDWADVVYAIIGGLLALLFAAKWHPENSSCGQHSRQRGVMAGAALVACSGLFIGATTPCVYCEDDYRSSRPVYMSYTDLQNAVSVDSPREITDISRLYLYGNYLLLNKRNEGVHVLDNSDPQNPVNELFIAIPGNTELSIRDNYLYADSYVDLVTFDLNDPTNIYVVDRQTKVFPWDAYQNVPDDIYFSYSEIDETQGVVVDYVR